MSFPTKQAKKEYDNNYLNYLMQQIKVADKIVQHNANSDLSFQDGQPMDPEAEPTDTRPLEEQLMDDLKQRKQAYKNASKLFNKDTSRIDKLMSYLQENEVTNEFNHLFPKIWKELGVNHAFATVQQVINMMEALIDNSTTTAGVAANDTNNNNNNILNAYGGFDDDDTAYQDAQDWPTMGQVGNDYINLFGGVGDEPTYDYNNANNYDPGDQGYFGWGFKSKKQMTVKEKKLQLKLNALLRGVKK
jgi:hypothetical protein